MSVKSEVMKALSEINVDVSFLERANDGVFPFVVYNVSEKPITFSDDEEDLTIFMITINIFSKPDYNFESLKNEIVTKMKTYGFTKTSIPAAEFLESENVYNQPIGFSYFK